MKIYPYYFLIISLFLGYSQAKDSRLIVRESKINEIHRLTEKAGFVTLPYRINFDSIQIDDYKVMYKLDSTYDELQNDGLHRDIVGILPDTSSYIGILYYIHGGVTNLNLMVYSKNGDVLEKKALLEEKCVLFGGEILECQEMTNINKDLTMDYNYNSRIVYENYDSADTISYDTVYTSLKRYGTITESGKVVFEKADSCCCSAICY